MFVVVTVMMRMAALALKSRSHFAFPLRISWVQGELSHITRNLPHLPIERSPRYLRQKVCSSYLCLDLHHNNGEAGLPWDAGRCSGIAIRDASRSNGTRRHICSLRKLSECSMTASDI